MAQQAPRGDLSWTPSDKPGSSPGRAAGSRGCAWQQPDV